MRNRTTILLLLACGFAITSAVVPNRQAVVCADHYDSDSDDFLGLGFGSNGNCPVESSRTPLERLLLMLSAGCAGAGLISAGKVLKDRQRDRELLEEATFMLGRQHPR